MWKKINLFAESQGRPIRVLDKKYFIELAENSLAGFMKMEIFKPNVDDQLFVRLEEAIN